MTENMSNNMLAGFLLGMAGIGMLSVLIFSGEVFLEWLRARRKINTDVPELQEVVLELKARLSMLESGLDRLRQSRERDNARGWLNGPSREIPAAEGEAPK